MTAKIRTTVHNTKKGEESEFSKARLLSTLQKHSKDLNTEFIHLQEIVDKVSQCLPDSLTVNELIELTSEIIASLTTRHYDHSMLASRLLSSKLQKELPRTFSENIRYMRDYSPSKFKRCRKLVSEKLYNNAMKYKEIIDEAIDQTRDYTLDYFAIKTLAKSYLLKIEGKPCETPQYMFMRVAIGIHESDIKLAIETYNLMSKKYFIHASPTLFNAGTDSPHLSSCFLLAMEGDSIDEIFKTVHKSALISKASGGIGMHVSNIRSEGSYIAGTNGTSSGLVPMLQVFNSTAKYVDQGGNKRPGAICIYLEPWHSDILDFLDMRKNHGKEEKRARDLFYALWISDLFMQKVEKGEDWCLFSEDECPGLSDCYGQEFEKLYNKYEEEGRYKKKIKAQTLWHSILVSQTETGNPFILYKDACNEKSNQKNLGTIKSSNLCCEIVEYSSKDETAVCNLGSLALPSFIKSTGDNISYDFRLLHKVCKVLAKNLNKIIDVGDYPIPEAKRSNMRHRPIAIGVQGLADVFQELRLPFGSPESRALNIQIFETIYHASLEASVELAVLNGPYSSYEGSPVSEGILQYDMWGKQPTDLWEWDTLKSQIKRHGVRNSLLVALMPTASTSQILGFTECFEPITSNIYTRRVLSGEFQIVNKYLLKDLVDIGLWSEETKNLIVLNNGSIQDIDGIPDEIKELYKTVWEIPQKVLIDMSVDRAPFVDQSQSLNLFLKEPTMSKLTSMHFYAWRKGLKTGMYYLRTQAASSAIKFTLDPTLNKLKNGSKRSSSEPATLNVKYLKRQKYVSYDSKSDAETDGDDYLASKVNSKSKPSHDIFDEKVIACNIKEPQNCDSCSG
ncbi:hypothetical protein CANARDRAFT_29345 [[Candida] arabinofermentans NRRL YB-2248]|uniref:Ribonucleoside-diphosphate reductase n=1 Tax=[Candida] arabinofermentans NRRL YB-2248 TaxID=983967 RepID=A0A1E4SXL6_9ASCO|nr:hypothetical protein CANARDRAFT_29345 [[Candida] arabinofermentans NRRL YB-2248]